MISMNSTYCKNLMCQMYLLHCGIVVVCAVIFVSYILSMVGRISE